MKKILSIENKMPEYPELELAVFNRAMVYKDVDNEIIFSLLPEHFFNNKHRQLWQIIINMRINNEVISVETVNLKLREMNKGTIYDYIQTPNNYMVGNPFIFYAKIIEAFTKRECIMKLDAIVQHLYNLHDDIEDSLNEIEITYKKALQNFTANTGKQITYFVEQSQDRMIERHDNRIIGKFSGIGSGLTTLDRITGGFQNGDFVVIAARPSIGKTALLLHLARFQAEILEKNVLIFSLEMKGIELIDRMVQADTNIDSTDWKQGNYDKNSIDIRMSYDRINQLNITIDDTGGQKIEQLRMKLKTWSKTKKYDIAYIDYLGLVDTVEKSENENIKIGKICKQIKTVAKEMNIPIVVLAQLNRDVTKRADKKPMLNDLRDSGNIEQDADLVMMLHRDAYYDNNIESNYLDIGILKHRNGDTGWLKVEHNNLKNKFWDLPSVEKMEF